MGKGRARHEPVDPRSRWPLPSERRAAPRYDVEYRTTDGALALRFRTDGTADFEGQSAEWSLEATVLRISTGRLSAEGAIGLDEVYLVVTPHDAGRGREELVLQADLSGPDTSTPA